MRRAARSTSGASNTAPTTATASAPASIRPAAFSGVIPPIATIGSGNFFAARNRSRLAVTVPGLVGDGKKLPKRRSPRPVQQRRAHATTGCTRHSNQLGRIRGGTRCIDAVVVLAQVHSVGSHVARQLDTVVDDEAGSRAAAQPRNRKGLFVPQLFVCRLVAVLHYTGAAAQRSIDLANQQRRVGKPGVIAYNRLKSAHPPLSSSRPEYRPDQLPIPVDMQLDVCQVYSCASPTASGTPRPLAIVAEIAEARVQPDP